MKNNYNAEYFFNIIEGKTLLPNDLFIDEPEELKPGLILGYAFDKLEEINDASIIPRLLKYIDNDPDLYNDKKILALCLIGSLGNQAQELLVESFIDSRNPDLSYTALCAMCNMLMRGVLSENMTKKVITRLHSLLTNLNCSIEESIECAKALKYINYKDIDVLISNAEKNMPGFSNELKAIL